MCNNVIIYWLVILCRCRPTYVVALISFAFPTDLLLLMNKLINFGWLDWFSLFLSVCRFCFVLQYPWWLMSSSLWLDRRQLGWCVCLSDVYLPALRHCIRFILIIFRLLIKTFPFFKQFRQCAPMMIHDDATISSQFQFNQNSRLNRFTMISRAYPTSTVWRVQGRNNKEHKKIFE